MKVLTKILNIILIVLSVSIIGLLFINCVRVYHYSEFYHYSHGEATYNGYEAFFGLNNNNFKYIKACGLGIFTFILIILNIACPIIGLITKRTLFKNITTIISMLVSLLVGIFFFRGANSLVTLASPYNNTQDYFTEIKPGYIICGVVFMIICVLNLVKLLFTPQPVSEEVDPEELAREKKAKEIERLKAELFNECSTDTTNTLELSEEEINSKTLLDETKVEKENE